MIELKAWFLDCDGKRWDTAVTGTTIRRVRSECDVQLLSLMDPKSGLMQKVFDDPIALFEVLCAVVRPQLKEAGLTDDEFGDRLNTETIAEAAVDAVVDGVLGFFPDERRQILAGAMLKLRQARSRARTQLVQKARERLESAELDAKIEKWIEDAQASVPGG